MNVQDLINQQPKLFKNGAGEPVSYSIHKDLFYFIEKSINENSRTLETGAGVSTVLFAMQKTFHTCIAPHEFLFDNIKEFCLKNQISSEKIVFLAGGSQEILPALELDDLDLVLIDGSHAFPLPFIDWYYTAQKLKVGGILIVDDVQLWTGEVLKDFLLAEPEWEQVESFESGEEGVPRTVIFEKKKEVRPKGWGDQLFVVRNSKQVPVWHLKKHGLPERSVGKKSCFSRGGLSGCITGIIRPLMSWGSRRKR